MTAKVPLLRALVDSRFVGREKGHDPKAATFWPDEDSLHAFFSDGNLHIKGLKVVEEGPGRTIEKEVDIEIEKDLIQEAMLFATDFTLQHLVECRNELKLVVQILRLIQNVDRDAVIRAANAIETLAGLDEG